MRFTCKCWQMKMLILIMGLMNGSFLCFVDEKRRTADTINERWCVWWPDRTMTKCCKRFDMKHFQYCCLRIPCKTNPVVTAY